MKKLWVDASQKKKIKTKKDIKRHYTYQPLIYVYNHQFVYIWLHVEVEAVGTV